MKLLDAIFEVELVVEDLRSALLNVGVRGWGWLFEGAVADDGFVQSVHPLATACSTKYEMKLLDTIFEVELEVEGQLLALLYLGLRRWRRLIQRSIEDNGFAQSVHSLATAGSTEYEMKLLDAIFEVELEVEGQLHTLLHLGFRR